MSPLVLSIDKAQSFTSDELLIIGQIEGETGQPLVQIMQRNLTWWGEGSVWISRPSRLLTMPKLYEIL